MTGMPRSCAHHNGNNLLVRARFAKPSAIAANLTPTFFLCFCIESSQATAAKHVATQDRTRRCTILRHDHACDAAVVWSLAIADPKAVVTEAPCLRRGARRVAGHIHNHAHPFNLELAVPGVACDNAEDWLCARARNVAPRQRPPAGNDGTHALVQGAMRASGAQVVDDGVHAGHVWRALVLQGVPPRRGVASAKTSAAHRTVVHRQIHRKIGEARVAVRRQTRATVHFGDGTVPGGHAGVHRRLRTLWRRT